MHLNILATEGLYFEQHTHVTHVLAMHLILITLNILIAAEECVVNEQYKTNKAKNDTAHSHHSHFVCLVLCVHSLRHPREMNRARRHTHTDMHTHTHTRIHADTHTHTHTRTHADTHAHSTHTRAHTHTHKVHTHTHNTCALITQSTLVCTQPTH